MTFAPRHEPRRIMLFANTDWYLYNFRLSLAQALRAQGDHVVLCSPAGRYAERLEGLGFCWREIGVARSFASPWHEATSVCRLARLLREERIALIHSCTLKCVLLAALASRGNEQVSRLHAMAGLGHAFSSTSPRARWLRPLLARMLAWACNQARTRTLVQNPDDAEVLLRRGIAAPDMLHVVRSSGVDLARFAPRQAAPAACLVVAFVARLLRSKGIEEFVEAARHVRRAGRHMRFVVAGAIDECHPDAVPAETINGWHREGVIHWVGHVDDVAAFLGNADVFVLPSYYGEGVPRSLVEAAACGLPLVTTNLAGCREVVTTNGIDGLHVPPRDANALAQALMTLDDDRALMARLGQAARIRAAEFAEDNILDQTLRLYEQLP